MKIVSYPVMKITCDICDCTFTFNYNDIDFWPTKTLCRCPLCNKDINLPLTYEEIRKRYGVKDPDEYIV